MRKRDKLRKGGLRLTKFTLIGLSNAIIDIGVLNLFLWLAHTREPWQLAIYNAIALLLVNINSYVWNSLWTFQGRAEHDLRQATLFILQAIANIGVGSMVFWGLIRPLLVYTDIPTYLVSNVAKIVSMLVASGMSFFLMRYIVFSRKRWFKGRL